MRSEMVGHGPYTELMSSSKAPVVLLREFTNLSSGQVDDVITQTMGRQFPVGVARFTTDFNMCDEEKTALTSRDGVLLGYRFPNGVFSIDHHYPVQDFMRHVSSTNLALLYVRDFGVVPRDQFVAINHTDTDSILASLVLTGRLPLEEQFGIAAICADHTGEENDLADLLMGLQDERSLEFCVSTLYSYLRGEKISDRAEELWNKRRANRARAGAIATTMEDVENGVYVGVMEDKIDSDLMISHLPKAKVIVLARRMGDGNRWGIKTRAGMRFPDGASLKEMDLPVPWGGRFNAGSTERGGGWLGENPVEFARVIARHPVMQDR